jgi:4-hydroxy-tetrahydrodipicolinate synthase
MRGVWTALITPFSNDGQIDLNAYRAILRDQKAAGVTGVIPCGTTGEAPTLSSDEKRILIRTALEEMKGSGVKVIAGTGSNNTAETVEFSRWASKAGVDGILVVTPYYNKPTPAGLEEHFKKVADAVACEVMLYNVPGRTGVSLTAASVSNLAAHPRIKSLKEATGNVAFTSEILDTLAASGHKIDILSGDDATYQPLLAVGAVGVVSVASNLFPRGMVAIQKAMEAGNLAEATKLHQRYYPLFRDLFIESNPGPIKWTMAEMGFGNTQVRAPLAPVSEETAKKLKRAMDRCGIKKGTPA